LELDADGMILAQNSMTDATTLQIKADSVRMAKDEGQRTDW
jgi:hypothetical protein